MKLQRALLTATLLSTVSLTAIAGGYGYSDGYSSQKKNTYAYNNSYSSSSSKSYGSSKKSASDGIVSKVDTSIGQVFSNAKGLTLYTFTKDSPATSNCYDGCAAKWPPFFAKAEAKTWGKFTIIERNDGSHQWAFDGKPLYTWIGDQQRGDTKGHGIGNVWYALKTQ